jgi:hypothetical protein
MRRQGNYIILINIASLRHWKEEVHTKKPELLLPLDVKFQE